jgi:hypothetical protein
VGVDGRVLGVAVAPSVDGIRGSVVGKFAAEAGTVTIPRLKSNPMMVKNTTNTCRRFLCDINVSLLITV